MKEKFEDLSWHDTVIKKIQIDPQVDNSMKIWVIFPEAEDDDVVCIEFYDCYAFQSDMHFGVHAT